MWDKLEEAKKRVTYYDDNQFEEERLHISLAGDYPPTWTTSSDKRYAEMIRRWTKLYKASGDVGYMFPFNVYEQNLSYNKEQVVNNCLDELTTDDITRDFIKDAIGVPNVQNDQVNPIDSEVSITKLGYENKYKTI